MKRKYIIIITVMLFFCTILQGTNCTYAEEHLQKSIESKAKKAEKPKEPETSKKIAIKETELFAKSAVLIDGDSGRVLYGKSGQEKLPMASTTKIMTCIVALENGNLDDEVTVTSYAAAMPKVKLGMRPEEKFKLRDLLYSLMLESHNDSAVAIAEHIGGSVQGFAKLMNEKAMEIGCYDTYFITPNGLDEEEIVDGVKKVHSTTAVDLARILKYCINESPEKDEFLKITQTKSYSFSNISGKRNFSCNNHNTFLTMMDGAISGKTGFTGDAGYCYVGALKRNDKTFIVALLACGWPNNKGYKWSDTKKLMNFGLSNYKQKEVFEKDKEFEPVLVENAIPNQNGDIINGNVYTNLKLENASLKLLLSDNEKVEVDYQLPKVLKAPIRNGEIVGYVKYRLNNEIIAEYPIEATENIAKINIMWCIKKALNFFAV